jgi:formate C-acetyltransferase
MDGRKGGVHYPQFLTHISDRCLQNVADSLAAIKKVVIEDKKITMEEMLEAVSSNFEGVKNESIRRMLIAAPKYGNDDDYVDEIFGQLSEWMQERISQEKNPLGTRMWQGRSGATAHWAFGEVTGALPDGRKAGEPLADGFLSPSQGVDSKGPTAVFNSATKANHLINSFAALFNMKFDSNSFDNRKKMVKYSNLVETFFERGGFHIQVNILSREILLDAQEHPEKYRNLLVRVAGFSAYFVNLPRALQDEIISRTDQPM